MRVEFKPLIWITLHPGMTVHRLYSRGGATAATAKLEDLLRFFSVIYLKNRTSRPAGAVQDDGGLFCVVVSRNSMQIVSRQRLETPSPFILMQYLCLSAALKPHHFFVVIGFGYKLNMGWAVREGDSALETRNDLSVCGLAVFHRSP